MVQAGASRRRIARWLSAGYAGGLLSEETFVGRVDRLFGSPMIDSFSLIGDLTFRGRLPVGTRVGVLMRRWLGRRGAEPAEDEPSAVLLALDWSGQASELLIGRSEACDLVLAGDTVSRRHARLVFRDGRWIVQDLDSTNGTLVNGTPVGRCQLWPGDRVMLGEECLTID